MKRYISQALTFSFRIQIPRKNSSELRGKLVPHDPQSSSSQMNICKLKINRVTLLLMISRMLIGRTMQMMAKVFRLEWSSSHLTLWVKTQLKSHVWDQTQKERTSLRKRMSLLLKRKRLRNRQRSLYFRNESLIKTFKFLNSPLSQKTLKWSKKELKSTRQQF